MGANSTKHSVQNEKVLVERFKSLETNDVETAIINEKPRPDTSMTTYRMIWKALLTSDIQSWEHQLLKDPKNRQSRLALSALSSADPKSVLTSGSTIIKDQQVFNTKIPFEGAPITNQRSSGRCWLFASTNVFRVALMKRHNLDKFELSQAYLFFYDKLEKANYFLEQILDTINEPLDERLLQTLLNQPVTDGGQWDMVVNLVEKYGLVPQVLYPDSFNAKSSYSIDELITTKLREDALQLRSLVSSGTNNAEEIISIQEKMVREIHLILTLTFGPPPAPDAEFTWNYIDKDGAAHELRKTPLEFAKELKSTKSIRITNSAVHDMISLVNDPRNEYNTLLAVDRLGNIVGGRGVTYVNVSIKTLKEACIKMLQTGLPVFFGSDVGKYSSSRTGIMDTTLIDYELGFNVTLGLTKAERLMTGESSMTHAMVLTAVHIEDGKSVRWRVQNSWGEGAGSDGWFVMSDAWMDQFVYQAVVEQRFVSEKVRDVLKTKPKILPLWDPMGSLA
ncbi:Bleomycin hydrolase [Golovinomyces cichoracearum]|uniref:Cysteine proteinase 1, mitochondrial n=1 Tax=Golovinomyces cichoracearum TaxID=62708 RepID=A0A420HRJ7_9PEZI|nr:Bleomycin hydrolase [Golovinomyces cichoracearum]